MVIAQTDRRTRRKQTAAIFCAHQAARAIWARRLSSQPQPVAPADPSRLTQLAMHGVNSRLKFNLINHSGGKAAPHGRVGPVLYTTVRPAKGLQANDRKKKKDYKPSSPRERAEHVCCAVSCAYIKSPRQKWKKWFTSIKQRKQRRRFVLLPKTKRKHVFDEANKSASVMQSHLRLHSTKHILDGAGRKAEFQLHHLIRLLACFF
jgi:hypothetical protein